MSDRHDLLFPGRHVPVQDYVEMAQRAEKCGWSGIWVSEVLSVEAFSLLGAIAQGTDALDLGTAIVPITSRSAPLLAMGAYTIAQLMEGELFLGVGVSTAAIMADRHDRPIERPLGETRDTVEIVRRALAGEKVTLDGTPSVKGFRLPGESSTRIQVGVAAVGPKMLALARECSDGVVLNLVSKDQAVENVRAAPSGREPPFQTIAIYRTAVEPTEDDEESLRREAASYCRVAVYRRGLEEAGWDIEAAARAESLEEAAKVVPAEFVDAVVIRGSARECQERLDDLRNAGVRPLVLPVGHRDTLLSMTRRIVETLGA